MVGYNTTSNGSNTVTIGDDNVTDTYLKGDVSISGGVRISNDTSSCDSTKTGSLRYRSDSNNSYLDMCMQTGTSTYVWINIKTNTW